MECPICGAELEDEGEYGYFASHQSGKKIGDIFRCPNGAEQNETCDSETFSRAGGFYTDQQGNLREGYPV